MAFHFPLMPRLFMALRLEDRHPVSDIMAQTPDIPENCQWGLFLRNHDELDLGRLTGKQRQSVFDAFGPEKGMQLYDRGIRRRFAPMLAGDPRRIRLAYSLMFTLPGTPVLRYGDEIGMGDELALPERDCARTPMQWTSEHQGGFSTAERTVLPLIDHGPYGYAHVNVADQRHEEGSLLNWMQSMIRQRKEAPEIGWGDVVAMETGRPSVLALRYEWRGNAILCVHNLAPEPVEVAMASGSPDPEHDILVDVLTGSRSEVGEDGRHCLFMEGYGYHWFRVGGLDALLKRRPA
jgi:maltose alpha-D-glucosyltransferase/alpha-amylase